MINQDTFRILHVNLDEGKSRAVEFGDPKLCLGGSGLTAEIFQHYGKPDLPWDDPEQPLIFAIGPLTGFFPLMSKVVMAFKSPYHNEFAESHAGGRMALAMRFTGYDAFVITGRAKKLSCLLVGSRKIEVLDAYYLAGMESSATAKHIRRMVQRHRGRRSIIRIGPAAENGVAYGSINVDTYRHFGRLGGGTAMAAKNLKAIVTVGDGNLDLSDTKVYAKAYDKIYNLVTKTETMKKYHDLGTPENILVLNELKSLPWRNLQATTDPDVEGITGERFAEELLLRKTACSGCPVGCIHIGLLRERFAAQHEFLYRQVNYDYEPIFADGSMLGMVDAWGVLLLLEEIEGLGMDVMSAGVALAWATEAFEKGLITEKETLTPLKFGDPLAYQIALRHLSNRTNDFYRELGKGVTAAAQVYGGADFGCVLGQEMAGYATGEVFYVSQAYGFRHSHLDSGGYAFDQKHVEKDVQAAVDFMVNEETRRLELTSMVSCLFARSVYTPEIIQEALESLGYGGIAQNLSSSARRIQAKRWRIKFDTGYKPENIKIPKRFLEVETWKGKTDPEYLSRITDAYIQKTLELSQADGGATPTTIEVT